MVTLEIILSNFSCSFFPWRCVWKNKYNSKGISIFTFDGSTVFHVRACVKSMSSLPLHHWLDVSLYILLYTFVFSSSIKRPYSSLKTRSLFGFDKTVRVRDLSICSWTRYHMINASFVWQRSKDWQLILNLHFRFDFEMISS